MQKRSRKCCNVNCPDSNIGELEDACGDWVFVPGFPQQVALLDVNNSRMRAVAGGAYLRKGVQPLALLVANGQSNFNESVVPFAVRDSRVAEFNTELTPLSPTRITPATVAAEEYARINDVAVVLISDNEGNTDIAAWNGLNPQNDMFARLQTKMNAFRDFMNGPIEATAIMWLHGSTNDYDKVVTIDGGYPAKFKQLQQRWAEEYYFGPDTMFITGEIAQNEITDTVNIAQTFMKLSGELQHYHIVPTRYLETKDRFHYSPEAAQRIGLVFAQAINRGVSDYINYIIDRPVVLNLSYFGYNLRRAVRYLEQFKFTLSGHATLLGTSNRVFSSALRLTGLDISNITVDGGGKVWSFPNGHGITTNSSLKLENVQIEGNNIDRRYGVLMTAGNSQLKNVAVNNFTGARSQGIRLINDATAQGINVTEKNNTVSISAAKTSFV